MTPPSGLTLKYIGLGLGTQNYSCATSDSSSMPVAIGALATLYDATALIAALPASSNAVTQTTCQADTHSNALSMLPRFGEHYFNASGVPSFDLFGAHDAQYPTGGLFLSARKTGVSPAPATACKGTDGAAAVPWLTLVDDGSSRTRGLKEVYRVETAGGSAPATCEGMEALVTRDYSAEYWFYG